MHVTDHSASFVASGPLLAVHRAHPSAEDLGDRFDGRPDSMGRARLFNDLGSTIPGFLTPVVRGFLENPFDGCVSCASTVSNPSTTNESAHKSIGRLLPATGSNGKVASSCVRLCRSSVPLGVTRKPFFQMPESLCLCLMLQPCAVAVCDSVVAWGHGSKLC